MHCHSQVERFLCDADEGKSDDFPFIKVRGPSVCCARLMLNGAWGSSPLLLFFCHDPSIQQENAYVLKLEAERRARETAEQKAASRESFSSKASQLVSDAFSKKSIQLNLVTGALFRILQAKYPNQHSAVAHLWCALTDTCCQILRAALIPRQATQSARVARACLLYCWVARLSLSCRVCMRSRATGINRCGWASPFESVLLTILFPVHP